MSNLNTFQISRLKFRSVDPVWQQRLSKGTTGGRISDVSDGDTDEEALEKIGRLVEEGSAALQLERSQSETENQALRRKLQLLESQLKTARARGEGGANGLKGSVRAQGGREHRGEEIDVDEFCVRERLNKEAPRCKEDVILEARPVELPSDRTDEDGCSVSGEIQWRASACAGVLADHQYCAKAPEPQPHATEEPLRHSNSQPPPSEPDRGAGGETGRVQSRRAVRLTKKRLALREANRGQKSVSVTRRGRPLRPKCNRTAHPPSPHRPDKRFPCSHCGKFFLKQNHVRAHQIVSRDGKPFSCPLCGKDFTVKCTLKLHQRTEHAGEKLYRCSHCGKQFSTPGQLRTHQVVHTGVKQHRCSHSYKTHKLVHTQEKPYCCETCGTCFSSSNNLKRHKVIHTGEKPFGCTVCRKNYNQSSHLREHQKTHADRPQSADSLHTRLEEKPHTCDVCGRTFRWGSGLRAHHRTHTGEKPHGCDKCGATFALATNLARHRRMHFVTVQVRDVREQFRTVEQS
ncbi:hypothetical protein GJAV_G00242460 [Gymnothorax javanicus]|nr:hypothetical protein GJAV_G00242460 [Gymnothorax javanicus]